VKNNKICLSKKLIKILFTFFIAFLFFFIIYRFVYNRPSSSKAFFSPKRYRKVTCIGEAQCQKLAQLKNNPKNAKKDDFDCLYFDENYGLDHLGDYLKDCTVKISNDDVKNNYINDITYIVSKSQANISTSNSRILNSIPLIFGIYFSQQTKTIDVNNKNYQIVVNYYNFKNISQYYLFGYTFVEYYKTFDIGQNITNHLTFNFVFPQQNQMYQAQILSTVFHEFLHGKDSYQEATDNQTLPPNNWNELPNTYYNDLFKYFAVTYGFKDENDQTQLENKGIIFRNVVLYLEKNLIGPESSIYKYLYDLNMRYIFLSYQRASIDVPENLKKRINDIETKWRAYPGLVDDKDFKILSEIKNKSENIAFNFFPASHLCYDYQSAVNCQQECATDHNSFSCKNYISDSQKNFRCCPL